jgi:hypothetical protein
MIKVKPKLDSRNHCSKKSATEKFSQSSAVFGGSRDKIRAKNKAVKSAVGFLFVEIHKKW